MTPDLLITIAIILAAVTFALLPGPRIAARWRDVGRAAFRRRGK